MSAVEVVVVVRSYEGRDDTLACLASIVEHGGPSVQTIVVDNASTDGTAAAVRAAFPAVEVLELLENVGFSAGNNAGLRRMLETQAEFALLLNNDTVLEPGAVDELVRVARTAPTVGAVCPVLVFGDDPQLVWYAGAKFDPRRGHPGRMLGYRERWQAPDAEMVETDRATGAAVLVPRTVLERVGLLDERYFFLYEDVEWSLRMARAGLKTYLATRARVRHRVASTQGGEHSVTSAYYGTRNQMLVCQEQAPLAGLAAARRETSALLVNFARCRRSRQRLASVRATVEGWRDFRRGRLGPRGGAR